MIGPGDVHPRRREFSEAAAAAALAPLLTAGPYLPWGAGSMRPAGLVAVCNEIVLSERRSVLELGSGTSTVLLARLLAQQPSNGERCQVAVEHDGRWAAWVEGQLRREDLHSRVSVLHVPLAVHRYAEPGTVWYDEDRLMAGLDAARAGRAVDLLLVDGPPADTSEKVLARYPALPVLRGRLAPGATVVLDDVERAGEQEVLRRWERETGVDFERRGASAGVAVGRLPGTPTGTGPPHG
jgi:predicted O-methyltransferase YrrM